MEKSHVIECREYFHCFYGNIDNSIVADSFFLNEYEEVSTDIVYYLQKQNIGLRMFLFAKKASLYPICFKDKYLGLWKNIQLERNISIENFYEQRFDLSRYAVFYGMAEISSDELVWALKKLQDAFENSFILFTKENINLKETFAKVIKNCVDISKDTLDFSNVINDSCCFGRVVTAIVGYNGTTINCFYKKNNNHN